MGSNMGAFQIRPLGQDDRLWSARLIEEHWVSTKIVTRGRVHCTSELPGFVAIQGGRPIGLLTYRIEGYECEIITMNSLAQGLGVGTALLDAVKTAAAFAKCKRLWLVTTNDNTVALRFYQKRGFQIAAVHRNALKRSRKLKPEIPLEGVGGVSIRDETELEIML
jgi:GNAT superfamily N-acetyltransferase